MRLNKWAAAAALAFVLALTACGQKNKDDGIATAGGAKASASAAPVDQAERGRLFAKCMREHGLDMPDPQSGDEKGGGAVFAVPKPGEGAPKMDKVTEAMAACKHLAPNGGEPPKLDPEQVAQMRKMAKCMRENGVPDFPEPDEDGMIRIEGPGSGSGSASTGGPAMGPDLKDPVFKAAMEKCRQFAPAGPSMGPAK